MQDGVDSEGRNNMDGIIRQLTRKLRETVDEQAGEEDSTTKLRLTPLTPLYAHAVFHANTRDQLSE
jgi:hypothetical protein